MSWPCRCRRAVCQARQNSKYKPETYKRVKRCKVCGKGEVRVDYWRKRNELGRPDKTCRPDLIKAWKKPNGHWIVFMICFNVLRNYLLLP